MLKLLGKSVSMLISGVLLLVAIIAGILYNLSIMEDAVDWWSSVIGWFS